VDKGQSALQSSVQGLFGGLLYFFGQLRSEKRLGVLDEHVAELGVPVLVDGGGGTREFTVLKSGVDLLSGGVELVQNPTLGERLLAGLGNGSLRLEIVPKLSENVLCSLVDLVTESTVTVNDLNVKCNITTYNERLAMYMLCERRSLNLPPVV
jgi:hypothetical protein